MTDEKAITTAETRSVERPASRQTVSEAVLVPPVDVYETPDGIVLTADLPGVSKDRLAINLDRDQLRIEGSVELDLPEGMNALYADVRSTRYGREFTLSSELDTEGIDANLKDGVLTLRIPRRAELRPRKIEIRGD